MRKNVQNAPKILEIFRNVLCRTSEATRVVNGSL
jgi:hypothetical protein